MVLNKLSELLFDLFVTREDVFAKQFLQKNGKKGFRTIKRTITPELIKQHLEDKEFLGVYNLDQDSKVKWGCLDFDENTPKDYSKAKRIYDYSLSKGLHPLFEKSGGGDYKVHIWFFTKEKIPAKQMREFLDNLCRESGAKPHEIFPKQDTISKGEYGNLVKLPLGLHLGTKKKSTIGTPAEIFQDLENIKNKLEVHKKHKDILNFEKENSPKQPQTEEINTLRITENPNPYDDFFNTVLNTELPEGQSKFCPGKITGVNDNVLKNMAIWFKIKGFGIGRLDEKIKPYYQSKGWEYGGLRGWLKKADKGDIMEISFNELKKWSNTYFPEYSRLLPTKKELKPIETENHDLMTYNDFKKLKKDKDYIIQDFLYPGTITMMYSPPANFKSLIAEYLVFCITNKKNFLGLKTKNKRKPVLYLDGENSNQILKERYQQIHRGLNLHRNKFPFYVLKAGMLMDSKKNVHLGFITYLEQIIEEKNIKLLVFDTLHRFAFYDENRSDDINILYTQILKPLIDKYNISILFLHHSTKKGDYRGSGDFLGIVDVSYSVIRQGKTYKFRIINEKCRSGEISDITGEIDFGEDYIKFLKHDKQQAKDKSISKLKEVTEKIKRQFRPGQEKRRKDIISHFEIEEYDFGSIKTIDRSLKYLVENEFLDKNEKGVYNLILR